MTIYKTNHIIFNEQKGHTGAILKIEGLDLTLEELHCYIFKIDGFDWILY